VPAGQARAFLHILCERAGVERFYTYCASGAQSIVIIHRFSYGAGGAA